MIVPQSKLLFWVGVLVLPFGALGVAVPVCGTFCFALIAGLAVVALVDAIQGWERLAGIDIELPAVVRLTKDRNGQIPIRVRNPGKTGLALRLGLAWPQEIRPATEDLRTELPAGSDCAQLHWPCQPSQRGVFALEQCHLEALSPLGFWAKREARPLQAELRVYPNLLGERRNLAALFLHRGNFGLHAQRQVGQGRDFEKLRDYIAGDGVEDIHWKATAKRSRPVTKVFQIERTQEVYVVLDASRLSGRPVPAEEEELPTAYLERFITAALIMGLVAEQQGDLFGVLSFADRVQQFVRARNGRAHYNNCRDALYALQPQPVSPDFESLSSFIRLRLRRRALLFVLTNLDDPILAESYTQAIELIGRQHLVLTSMVRPRQAQALFGGNPPSAPDELYQRLGGHVQWHNLRELGRILKRRGVGFQQLEHEQLAVDLVTQYLNVKRRQLL